MAAEDYLPGSPYDDEDWGNEPSWPPSGKKPYCKYCNAGPLRWQETSQGWRLTERSGKLHKCPPHTFAPKVFNTPITQAAPTTYHQEPIMDKNAVAFIRNDVRTLRCVFLATEHGACYPVGQLFPPEEIAARSRGYKTYTYLTTDPDIIPGDFVIVAANGLPKVVYVVSTSPGLDIEPNANREYAFTIGRVSLTPYFHLCDQNKAIGDMVKNSYKDSIRRGFRETLLAGLPADEQTKLQLILNPSAE